MALHLDAAAVGRDDLADQRQAETEARAVAIPAGALEAIEDRLRNAGQVVSRTMILERVWGYGFDPYSN